MVFSRMATTLQFLGAPSGFNYHEKDSFSIGNSILQWLLVLSSAMASDMRLGAQLTLCGLRNQIPAMHCPAPDIWKSFKIKEHEKPTPMNLGLNTGIGAFSSRPYIVVAQNEEDPIYYNTFYKEHRNGTPNYGKP